MTEWASLIAEAVERPREMWALLRDVPLAAGGTEFQRRVWEALRAIPAGETRSYGDIGAMVGGGAVPRAVGAACGANPVLLLIPCHRAIGADGSLTGFRGGIDRKRELLRREGAAGFEGATLFAEGACGQRPGE